jgi:hypothetical protein
VKTVFACALMSFGLSACPISTPPVPTTDSCTTPAPAVGVTRVEIGTDSSTWTPLPINNGIPIDQGFQGGSMLLARLRITAPSLPKCIAQRSQISVKTTLALDAFAVPVKSNGDGTWTTSTIVMVLDYVDESGPALVTSTVGGVTGSAIGLLHYTFNEIRLLDALDSMDPAPPVGLPPPKL